VSRRRHRRVKPTHEARDYASDGAPGAGEPPEDRIASEASQAVPPSPQPPFPAASDRPRRKSARGRKVLLFVVSFLSACLIAEAVVRLFFADQVDTERLMATLRARSIRDIKQPSPDPVIGFELKPNLALYMNNALILTDAEGHRIPSHPVRVPPNAVRIAVVGDSSSFGWGVNYEDSYPYLYRQAMERTTNVPVELKNFSVPAYDSKQEARVFLTKILPYKPDLVILHHDNNDASAPLALWKSDGVHPTYGDNPLGSALIKFAMRRIQSRRNRNRTGIQIPYDKAAHEFLGRGGYIASGPLYDEHLRALDELSTKARSLNIPVVAVLFDPYAEFDAHYENNPVYIRLHKRLAEFLTQRGVYVLDLYPAYQQKMREMGWSDMSEWWVVKKKPEDPHPNAKGHRFIAERLVEFTLHQPRLMDVFRNR